MLLGNFFTINEISGPLEEVTPAGIPVKKYHFRLTSVKDHPVYDGHFPGNPVTPGVFQVQMIHELVSEVSGLRLRLINSDNIKYLSMMIPSMHSSFECQLALKEMSEQDINVTASLFSGETIFIKFKGIFSRDDR